MARYASWVVNVALAALACFLVAQSANSVFAALLTNTPSGDPIAPTPAGPALSRAWSDREIILTRNLFNASILAPALPAVPVEEDLEATQLPLTLLGTAAADLPELSWAAIEDRESQQTLTVKIDDSVRGQAVVRRIERKRVVLEENGALRELALEEPADLPTGPAPLARTPRAARLPSRRPVAPPLPELGSGADEGSRSPAQLFSEARILPKYDAGQMVGVQVSAIKPGSLFEKMGLADGEVITELNGIRIDSPEQSAKILLELTRASTFTIQVVDGQGGTRTLSAELPEP